MAEINKFKVFSSTISPSPNHMCFFHVPSLQNVNGQQAGTEASEASAVGGPTEGLEDHPASKWL